MIPKKQRSHSAKLGFAGPDASANNRRKASALLRSDGWEALRPRIANQIADEYADRRDAALRAAVGGSQALLVSHLASKVRKASLEDLMDTQRIATTADVREVVRTASLADRRDAGLAHVAQISDRAWRRDPEGWVTAGQLREWRAAAMTVAQGKTAVDEVLSDRVAEVARFDVHGDQLRRVAATIHSQSDFDGACQKLGLIGDRIDHRLARAFLARVVNTKASIAPKQAQQWDGNTFDYGGGVTGEISHVGESFEWVVSKDGQEYKSGGEDSMSAARNACDHYAQNAVSGIEASKVASKTAAKWEQNHEGNESSLILVDDSGNVLGATADGGSDGFCAYVGDEEWPMAQGLASLEEAKAAVEEAVGHGIESDASAKVAQDSWTIDDEGVHRLVRNEWEAAVGQEGNRWHWAVFCDGALVESGEESDMDAARARCTDCIVRSQAAKGSGFDAKVAQWSVMKSEGFTSHKMPVQHNGGEYTVEIREFSPNSFSMKVVDAGGEEIFQEVFEFASFEAAETAACLLLDQVHSAGKSAAQVWSPVDDFVWATEEKNGYYATVREEGSEIIWEIIGPEGEMESEGRASSIDEAKLEAESAFTNLIGE